ncbi:MAG: adenosylcobinamide-GDP ribazoletransferase [Lachnospiraceae bacterium]
MKRMWNSFIIAFSMYSKIPVPMVDWTEENMKYPICFFPMIGMVIGAVVLGFGVLTKGICTNALFPAAGFVVLPILISGGIHMDGFADTVDALSSNQPMERKLEILKDSHAGAFSMIVLCCYFLAAAGIWSEMPSELLPVAAVSYTLSRALSGFAMVTFPHAKTSTLLAAFADGAKKKNVRITMIGYILCCAGVMLYLNPYYGIAGILGAAAALFYYYHTVKKNFGGITGDLAGFFVQICEVSVPAFILAAYWISC